MPNHIKNVLKVTRAKDKEQASEIASKLKDFNTITPMPKELIDTQSPARIISQEEWDKEEAMTPEERKEKWLSRGITQEMSDDFNKRFGFNNWYDWARENWGTKWNAYDITHEEGSDTIEFDTAWSMPEPIIARLSEMYPEAELFIKFSDEDMHGANHGMRTYINGSCTEDCEMEQDDIAVMHGYESWEAYEKEYEEDNE